MTTLDGKRILEVLKQEIAEEVKQLKAADKKAPHLAAVLAGDNGVGITYVNSKVKACEQVGFASTLVKLPVGITEEVLLKEIDKLNANADINGYTVQLPLPKHIDEQKILLVVDPKKDVGGSHPANFGRIVPDMEAFTSATPFGIMELLKRYEVPTKDKHVAVVGRSHIVGRPISTLLNQKGAQGSATATLTYSYTPNFADFTRQADITAMALGIPKSLKGDMVKEGVTVTDVGITRLQDDNAPKGYRIVGDVVFDRVKNRVNYITPISGGVGPMTTAMLLKNILPACKWRESR